MGDSPCGLGQPPASSQPHSTSLRLIGPGGVGRRGDKGVAECEGELHSTSENRRGRWQTSVVKERGGSMEKTERL